MIIKPYRRKAYYYECDKMNIVHHSNYIRWFEEARVDLLEQIDCPFEKIEVRGLMSPVLTAQAEYKYPVHFADEFQVKCRMTEFNGTKYAVEYEVYNLTENKLSCTGKTTHCFTNSDMRPTRLKHSHPDIYEKFREIAESEDIYGG